MTNEVDDGSGTVCFQDYFTIVLSKFKETETDIETHYKDTFRVFSKDDEGNVW